MSDLLYSDTEEALRDSVRRLFADRCRPEAVMRAYDPAPQDFSDVWQTLAADLGVAGLLVPEQLGGAGAGAREAAVVMEEIGRAVAPVPFLSSAVLATIALLHAGDTETVKGLATGSLTAALTVPLSTAPDDVVTGVSVTGVSVTGDGLTGRITSVAGAGEADVLVVPVAGPDGLELHTVSRDAAGVDVSPVLTLDMTRPLANIEFSSAASSRVGTAPAEAAVTEALETGAALLASEQLGIALWCLDTTLAYVKQRRQFGRAIGSYQAIKHRLADLWIEVNSAAAAARYAADTCARQDEDATIGAAVAQAYCSGVAVHAAEECVQLHGAGAIRQRFPCLIALRPVFPETCACCGGLWRYTEKLPSALHHLD